MATHEQRLLVVRDTSKVAEVVTEELPERCRGLTQRSEITSDARSTSDRDGSPTG